MKEVCIKRVMFTVFLSVSLLIFFSNYALAKPHKPPQQGKAWVEVGGKWKLVIAPPGVGPYIWVKGKWVIDPTPPPPGCEWVPPHWISGYWKGKRWVPGYWIAGYWNPVPLPCPGAIWVVGHWEKGRWVPGYWKGKLPRGKHWVPGHWDPDRRWRHGNWR